MVQKLITSNDITDGTIADSKFATGINIAKIPSSSIPGSSINLHTIPYKLLTKFPSSILRNGKFDENNSYPPTGWSTYSTVTHAITGTGLGDTTRSGITNNDGWALKLSGTTSGMTYDTYQDVSFTSLGFHNGALLQPSSANILTTYLSFNYKTNATAGVKMRAILDGTPDVASPTEFQNVTLTPTGDTWRTGEITLTPNFGYTTFGIRIELGLNGTSGGSYVYFDDLVLYPINSGI